MHPMVARPFTLGRGGLRARGEARIALPQLSGTLVLNHLPPWPACVVHYAVTADPTYH
jgi:hypothetical protein